MNENAHDLVHEGEEHRLLCIAIESLVRAGAEPREIDRHVRMLRGHRPSSRRTRALNRLERTPRGGRRPFWRYVTGE